MRQLFRQKQTEPAPKKQAPNPKPHRKQQTKGDGNFLCPHSRSLALARVLVGSFLHLVPSGALLICLLLVLACFFFPQKRNTPKTQKKDDPTRRPNKKHQKEAPQKAPNIITKNKKKDKTKVENASQHQQANPKTLNLREL